ncbi:MAG: hypothetical protein GY835_01380 [bacterium]|nr:hypothetical protein [bacterium]
MTTFRWLHLSDLHRTRDQTGSAILWPRLRQKFLEDLEVVSKLSGPWDAVFFTGDLTFSGASEEFKMLDDILKEIWQSLSTLRSTPILLPVPGNHDLKRPTHLSAGHQILKIWDEKTDLHDDFFKNEKDEYRKQVSTLFTQYSQWLRHTPLVNHDSFTHGALPGDFSRTLDTPNDLKIGVVGLNSAYQQVDRHDYSGKIFLHPQQVHQACGGDADKWRAKHDFAFLLIHHPIDWLSSRSKDFFYSEIAPPGRFNLILHGHLHENASLFCAKGGSQGQQIYQAASLFGVENWGEKGELRNHGYYAGRLELIDSTAKITLFPRKAEKIVSGEWAINVDTLQGTDAHHAIRLDLQVHRRPAEITHAEEAGSSGEGELLIYRKEQQPDRAPVKRPPKGPKPDPRLRIAILATGRDAPGVNACIRSLVRVAAARGIDVIGIQNGFSGLAKATEVRVLRGSREHLDILRNHGGAEDRRSRNEDAAKDQISAMAAQISPPISAELDARPFFFYNRDFAEFKPDTADKELLRKVNKNLMRQVSMIIHRGGSILLSGQCPELRIPALRDDVLAQMKSAIELHNVTHLVIIGGGGSSTAACHLARYLNREAQAGDHRCRIIVIPASVENDLFGLTDATIGYDTALKTTVECIDFLRDTGDAMVSPYFVEIAAENSNMLAAEAAIASGAEFLYAPLGKEDEGPMDFAEKFAEAETKGKEMWGNQPVRKTNIIIVKEHEVDELKKALKSFLDEASLEGERPVNLHRLPHGGPPTARDRVIATLFGHHVAAAIAEERLFISGDAERDPFSGAGLESPLLVSIAGTQTGWSRLVLVGEKLDVSRNQRIVESFEKYGEGEDATSQQVVARLQRVLGEVSRSYFGSSSSS